MTSVPVPFEVSACSLSIKQEPGTFSTMEEAHSHHFRVRADSEKIKTLHVTCTRPCTVLEAIQSDTHCRQTYEKNKYSDSTIKIQMGRGSKEFVIATHFPCCKIPEGELLTLWDYKGAEQEEHEAKTNDRELLSADQYITFYIYTRGGDNAMSKQLFTDSTLTKFMFLSVCEERDIDVKEALGRDGRFRDLGNFFLTDIADGETTFSWGQPITSLEGKKLKISYDYGQAGRGQTPQKAQSPGGKPKKKGQTAEGEAAQTDEFQDKSKADGHSSHTKPEKIYNRLCKKFPDLQKWIKSRFPGDSLLEALKQRHKNFGKIQEVFAEVYQLRQLIKRGQSVCKITVKSEENPQLNCKGTGFVLVGQYVLTNAHLFTKSVDENKKLLSHAKVSAMFDYESGGQKPLRVIPVKDIAAYNNINKPAFFDYAILELEPGATKVPPGLLGHEDEDEDKDENEDENEREDKDENEDEHKDENEDEDKDENEDEDKDEDENQDENEDEDENTGACIIGHPGGGVKKLDITWVIKEKDRGESAGSQVTGDITMIIETALKLEKQKIKRILAGGDIAGQVVTYNNTFMYHGSSGSPVFDADGRVFGLHTYGYGYQHQQNGRESTVIACAQRLDNILKDLRSKRSGLWPSIEEQLNPEMKRQLGLTTQ